MHIVLCLFSSNQNQSNKRACFCRTYAFNQYISTQQTTSYCRTRFSMGDLGVQVSVRSSVCPFVHPSTFTPGCLVSATTLTFLYRTFWNFACVFAMLWGLACGLDIILRSFSSLFPLCELSHFLTSIYRQWVPCERNSSQFYTDPFETCTCFLHGLKMCMRFGYNSCVNFWHFFHFANFVISWLQILWKCIDCGYLVSAAPHTILYQSLWNFAHVFAMVWRWACDLDKILKLIFVNFVIFWPQILWKCIDSGYHVSAILYTASCLSLFNFAHLFVHGLKMCMWFGFNPAVNFCHFSTLLTLSFFEGATTTSPKFDLYLWFASCLIKVWQYF